MPLDRLARARRVCHAADATPVFLDPRVGTFKPRSSRNEAVVRGPRSSRGPRGSCSPSAASRRRARVALTDARVTARVSARPTPPARPRAPSPSPSTRSPTRVAFDPNAGASRPRPRASASDDAANKWELAASFAHARRAQDECLDVVLGEMAALTREVAQLRREVDALNAERSAGGRRRSTRAGRRTSGAGRRTSGAGRRTSGAGRRSPPAPPSSQAEKEARDMLDALVPAETVTETEVPIRIRTSGPLSSSTADIADVPVRIGRRGLARRRHGSFPPLAHV